MKMSTVVVDDEPLARRRLARLLEADGAVEVVAVCATGRDAVRAVRQHKPDLLFLDVQMPEMDGFGVLRELGDGPLPQVVFVTAYDQYAIQAFEVHALDYLLKPYTPARLGAAVQRALKQLQAPPAAPAERLAELLEHLERERRALDARLSGAPPAPGPTTRVMVKQGERMFFVPVERIDWLEAEGNYVRLHCGKEAHLVRATLSGMEEQLDPRRFTRIHRGTIVNLDRVKEVRPWFAGDYMVKLHDGGELRLSRRYRDRLL
ncbi:MAG TPA: LytTR family DNA-binding domain-containing protein [Longimicrobium sp.]|jgi:two-component system LytT family response regulator|uniref:LytR/AlgR family response regulator transcription factor n=1 Tax=Longimicrobium sp. TaxID=2029185 RepID=UPI002ED831C2